MDNSKSEAKYISVIVFSFVVICFVALYTMVSKATNNIYDLESQKQENEEQQSSFEEQASKLQESKVSLENLIESLNSELAVMNEKISNIEKQIEEKKTEIENTKKELEEAKTLENKQYEDMKLRIRFMYEMGDKSYFEILFSEDSLAESLNKVEYVSELVSYDRVMMNKYVETKQLITDKETNLANEQQELYTLKAQVEEQQSLIGEKINSTNEEIKAYSIDLDAAYEAALEYEKKVEENEQAINDESRRIEEESILAAQRLEQEKNKEQENNYVPASSDLDMLAALIECEAGDQEYYGMLCVGAVVINRINSSSFPDTLYGVLYQPYQFSPVTANLDGINRFGIVLLRGANTTCYQAAQEVLDGNIVGTWLYFRMNNGTRDGEVIGDHVFY